jgi:hypothetical protein
LYVVVNITTFFSVTDRLLLLFKNNDDIGDCIYNSIFIVILANCTCVPVLAWLDTPKAVHYFKKWEKFQVGSDSDFLRFDIQYVH